MTVKSTDCVPLKTWNQKRKGLPVSELSDSTKPRFLRPLPSSSTIVLCLTVCSSQDTFLSNSMTTLSLFLLQAFLHRCTSLNYTSRSQCPCTGTCWIMDYIVCKHAELSPRTPCSFPQHSTILQGMACTTGECVPSGAHTPFSPTLTQPFPSTPLSVFQALIPLSI